MLGVVLAGILQHPRKETNLGSVLKAIEELFGQGVLSISDPINQISEQTTKLTQSMKTGEDFQILADRVSETIGKTTRACFYFLHVIEPLWARKSRGLEVRQSDIDKCQQEFDSKSDI
jgi:hypothetical protein